MGIAVAFLDDGINKNLFPELENLLNYEVKDNKIAEYKGCANDFEITHASICLKVFLKYNKKYVDIISIKVLNKEKICDVDELIVALDWVKENRIPIVNMSLGTSFYSDKRLLNACINDLTSKGIVIIAAQNNINLETFPASFSNVIGVMSSNNNTDMYQNINYLIDGIEFCAKSIHTIYFPQNKLDTSKSNSFSAPYVTALVTNQLWDMKLNIFSVKKKLSKLCGNNLFRLRNFDWCQNAVIICSRNDTINTKHIYFNIVKKLFYDNVDVNEITTQLSSLMNKIDTVIIIDKKNKFQNYNFIKKMELPCLMILGTGMYVDLNKEYCMQVPVMNYLQGIKKLNFNQVDIPIVVIYYQTNDFLELINLLIECQQLFIKEGYGCRCLADNGISLLYGFDNIEYLNAFVENVDFYCIDLLIVGLDYNTNYEKIKSDIAFKFCEVSNSYDDTGIEEISCKDSLYNKILEYFI